MVEPDRGPVVLRVPKRDWAGDQRQPQMTTPDWTRWHLHGLVAREIGPPCPLSFARILGFGLVIFERIFDPREMIADRFLDLRERILDVATITAVLRDTSLVAGDLQGLPKPIETLAGQEERIRNKGLAAHASEIEELAAAKKEAAVAPRANRAMRRCQDVAAPSCSAKGSTEIETAWEYPHDLVRPALASPPDCPTILRHARPFISRCR